MRMRWLVFAPAAVLAFVSSPAHAEDRILLSPERPSVVLSIAAGQFEVRLHSDQECSALTVDPYLELLDPSGIVVAADDDGWHRQGDCVASRLSGVAGDGFQIRVRGCCGRLYGSVRLEWVSGYPPEMSSSTEAPSTSVLEPSTTEPATTVLPSTLPPVVTDPSTTIAVRDSVPVSTLPATTVEPAPTTTEVISWPTTTIPVRTTATAAIPDPVADTSVPTSMTASTISSDTTIAKPVLSEPDLFDGTHDDVIPSGSTISVAQRRTVVAVSAVFFIAVPRPSSSSNGSRRRK